MGDIKDDYCTVAQAGEILDLTVSMVRILILNGKIPAVKIGRSYIIEKAVVYRVKEEREGKTCQH